MQKITHKETTSMTRRFMAATVIAASVACAATFAPLTTRADPAHPTASEVTSVAYMLDFRSGMLADPGKTVAKYAVGSARAQFATIDKQMAKAGSGALGWRYLLSTAVFTAAGLNERRALIVFYNPAISSGRRRSIRPRCGCARRAIGRKRCRRRW
jgi:hypothetical protein